MNNWNSPLHVIPAISLLEGLLGRNYAFFILGITSLKEYDLVATIDPGKAAGSFAQHARDELGTSRFAGVVAEGGQALWRFSTEVEVHQTLHASQPKIDITAAKTLGVQSLDRAISMEPSNATWRSYRIPILISRSNFNIVMPLTTTEAYGQVKEDMSVLTGSRRYSMLDYAAKLAVKVSELNDAQSYAQELLKSSTDPGNNYGNAIFFANLVFGQVALRQGNIEAAKAHLIAAGKTPGSPALDSFGPNMSLAKDLFEAGERGAILTLDSNGDVLWAGSGGAIGFPFPFTITRVAIAPDGRTVFSGYLESSRDISSEGSDFLAIRSGSGITSLSLLRNGADAGIAFAQAGVVLVAGTSSAIAAVDDTAEATPGVSGISSGAAANASAQVSPGEIITIYGANLGPAAPLTPGATAAEPAVPTELGGVRVLFDGIPAPLLYVSSNQINAIVPFATAGKTETRMVVDSSGVKSLDARLGVVSATPALVTTGDVNRGLPVAAINQDGTVNSASNPAAPGTIVAVFGTGFGMMTPAPQDGSLVSALLPSLSGGVNMFGGPGFVDVLYAGPAPAEVAGVVSYRSISVFPTTWRPIRHWFCLPPTGRRPTSPSG